MSRMYIRKTSDMIPGVNITSGKASVECVNGAGRSGGYFEPLRGGEVRGRSPLTKLLYSKEYLDWLKIDLNAVEIITVQDY